MKAAFLQYDVNKDGNISQKELEDGMVQTGQFSFDEARQAFEIADINGDGEIDIAEFVQVTQHFTCNPSFYYRLLSIIPKCLYVNSVSIGFIFIRKSSSI